MLVDATALMLDFFAHPARLPQQLPADAELWDMTARQRDEPPHRYQHVLLSAIAPGTAPPAAPGAALSVGPFQPRHAWQGDASHAPTRFALIALTNPREGMEAEYEDWYWNRHFPDGLRLPGCFAGRRYLRADAGLGAFHHLAIYLFDNPDVGETLDVLKRILRTPEMPGSPAISPVVEDWYVQPRR